MDWRLGVIGSPIAHSLSPRLHEAALSALGLTGSSEAIDIRADDHAALTEVLATHDALSVTMPLKEVAVERCDELDDVSRHVGAVNSLRIFEGRVVGRSTDGDGFIDAVRDEFAVDLDGAHVVVRGSGGSAKSIIDALVRSGARVSIVARNADVAVRIVERYESVEVNAPVMRAVDLIVNTIPAGAFDSGPLDGPTVEFCSGACALDVVYEPRESPWLAERRADGLRCANGLSMLVHQARHQMQWWFDQSVPLEPLFAAVGR